MSDNSCQSCGEKADLSSEYGFFCEGCYAVFELTVERDEARAEVRRLRQALGEYGQHDAGCPKRYVQVQFCARMKTEGKCECGLDEELGIAAAAPEER
jgi:hypothetical protein